MKRVLFSMVLLLAAGFTFAQEKSVKEAKSIANDVKPDFAQAEKLINEALNNAETKDNAETWDVAGFIQKRINEKEMENAYLRKPYDTLKVYNSALNMCKYYFKCDELAQIPNEKGKIKNKFRRSNSAAILAARPNLINGGIQFFNLDKNKEALDFFATYVDIAINPMFEKENLLQTDTVLPQIAYYASLAAAKMEDYPSVLKYAPYAKEDKEVGKYAMEFISTALKAQGDTVKWIASLKDGIQKYPEHSFFFGHLIDYYSNNNKFDEAMQFADDMLAKDPNNTFYLYVKGYLYHNMKDYEKAIEFYNKTIEVDPNSGPRHLTFSPNGKYAYLISELSGNITTFSYLDGKLEKIQTIAADTLRARGSADIHLSPDGKYLYASNRLKGDGLAIFEVNPETGMLAKVGYQLTGIHPRNFIITPNGKYLLAACRDSHVIQVFQRDSVTGLLSDTHQDISIDKPVCIQFVK